MYQFQRYWLPLVGIIAGSFTGWMLVQGTTLLLGMIVVPDQMDVTEWQVGFQQALTTFVVSGAAFLALLWAVVTFVDDGIRSDRRMLWLVLFGIAGLLSLLVMQFQAPAAGITASFAGFLSGPVTFWLCTALTTGCAHKYAPLLSSTARRGW